MHAIRSKLFAVLGATVIASLLLGCSDRASTAGQPVMEPAPTVDRKANAWTSRMCGPEFASGIERLAGASAIDCGMHETPEAAVRGNAQDCMRSAIEAGTPFKAGHYGYGDSYQFCDVAIGTKDRKFLAVFLHFNDEMEGGRRAVSASRCAEVSFDPSPSDETSFFALKRCVDAADLIDLAGLDRGADGT